MSTPSIKGSYGSSTVAKGLEILDVLAAERRPMAAAEIARCLDINPSSIYRILATLVRYNYVTNVNGTSRYFLGSKLLTLSSVVLERLDVRAVCRPYLEELVANTGEVAHLMLLDGTEGLYIERVESPQTIQMASSVGKREYLHASGVGKAILAFLPEDEVDRIIQATGLPGLTGNTITNAEQLKQHLDTVRRRGFAIDDMEAEDGIRCIGAPVFNHEGKVNHSISIAGPAYRLSLEKLHTFSAYLLDAASRISADLGHQT